MLYITMNRGRAALQVHILHEGGGVHYGVFPGDASGPGLLHTLWVLQRPHNWRASDAAEHLIELDAETGAEQRRVQLPTRFAHDAVRRGDRVYVCDTGSGGVLEFAFPEMQLLRRLPLFSAADHPNTLAPLAAGELFVMLHNLGQASRQNVGDCIHPAPFNSLQHLSLSRAVTVLYSNLAHVQPPLPIQLKHLHRC